MQASAISWKKSRRPSKRSKRKDSTALHLAQARVQMGRKYNGGHGRAPVADPPPKSATGGGRNRRWVVVVPHHTVSWDNFKLGRGGAA
jgi:hypothetical protein